MIQSRSLWSQRENERCHLTSILSCTEEIDGIYSVISWLLLSFRTATNEVAQVEIVYLTTLDCRNCLSKHYLYMKPTSAAAASGFLLYLGIKISNYILRTLILIPSIFERAKGNGQETRFFFLSSGLRRVSRSRQKGNLEITLPVLAGSHGTTHRCRARSLCLHLGKTRVPTKR